MVNGLKHCSKLKDSTFTIFIDSCAWNSCWERVAKWYGKSQNCLLTHWLLITSILFWIVIIYSTVFRCKYLRNEKYLLNFFLLSVNLDSILKICKRNEPHSWCILNWRTPKYWLDQCLKSPVSEDRSTSNMVNWKKHCPKLNHSTFTIVIDPCEDNSGLKSLSEWYANY